MFFRFQWVVAFLMAGSFHAAVLVWMLPTKDGTGSAPPGQMITAAASLAEAMGGTPKSVVSTPPDEAVRVTAAPPSEPVSVVRPPSNAVPVQSRPPVRIKVPTVVRPQTTPSLMPLERVDPVLPSRSENILRSRPADPAQPVKQRRRKLKRKSEAVVAAAPKRKSGVRRTSKHRSRNVARKKPARVASLGNSKRNRAGTRRSAGGGRGQASAGQVRSYGQRVQDRVRARLGRTASTGRVVLRLRVNRRGGLQFARVVKSSGNRELDRMALAAARRAAPFPKPPTGISTGQLLFQFGVRSR